MGRNRFRILDLRKKFPICSVGSASFLFSSKAPYPYLFLGWHNKERKESAKKQHIPITFGRFGIVRETELDFTEPALLFVGSYHSSLVFPSSARRVRPWPSLVSSSRSTFFAPLPPYEFYRASHSSPLSLVPLLRKSRGLCVFRKLKSLVKLKTDDNLRGSRSKVHSECSSTEPLSSLRRLHSLLPNAGFMPSFFGSKSPKSLIAELDNETGFQRRLLQLVFVLRSSCRRRSNLVPLGIQETKRKVKFPNPSEAVSGLRRYLPANPCFLQIKEGGFRVETCQAGELFTELY